MSPVSKHVLVLVGLKGAGKTTIGAFLERAFGLRFLRVEPLWIEHRRDPRNDDWERDGYQKVANAVRGELVAHDVVVIELTGASAWTKTFVDQLRTLAKVHLARVEAPPEVCLGRVRGRDATDHIPVSDERVAEINAAAASVSLTFDASFANVAPWDEGASRTHLRALLQRLGLG